MQREVVPLTASHMLLAAPLVSIRAAWYFTVSGFEEFIWLFALVLDQWYSSQKRILPCSALPLSATSPGSPSSLLPPATSPAVYYLSAMSNAVQREAGGGSCLFQPRDSTHGAQQKNSTPHSSSPSFSSSFSAAHSLLIFSDKPLPPVVSFTSSLVFLSLIPLSFILSILIVLICGFLFVFRAVAHIVYNEVMSSLFIYFILLFVNLGINGIV